MATQMKISHCGPATLLAIGAALMPLAASQAPAALVAQDSFTTGTGQYVADAEIVGQGPSRTGFSVNWAGSTGVFTPIASGLDHAAIVGETGGAIKSINSLTSGNPQVTRSVSGGLAVSPANVKTPIFISALLRQESVILGGGTNNVRGDNPVWLAVNGKQLLGGNGTVPNTGVGGTVRYASGGGTGANATDATFVEATTSPWAINTTYLLVVKIVPGTAATNASPGSGQELVDYWWYASGSSVPASEPASGMLDDISAALLGSNGLINNVGFGGGKRSSVIGDEIRIGSQWSDVVVVPEPASMVLVGGIAASGLLLRRRRGMC